MLVRGAFPTAGDQLRQPTSSGRGSSIHGRARRRRLSGAVTDWGFAPQDHFERGFSEYLIPTIRKRYAPS